MADAMKHIPVMPREVVRALSPASGETYVDLTAGLGGHAALAAGSLGTRGRVVLNDLDPGNLAHAARAVRGVAADGPELVAWHGNFAEVPHRLRQAGIQADCVLADLGFASNQMDDGGRGFSFMRDGPLDMRMNRTGGLTAADLVNQASERELRDWIREFGEDPAAARIAHRLIRARSETPILTTGRLAEVVRSAVGGGRGGTGIDPSTRTFQALRIVVNDELGSLGAFLGAIARKDRAEWLNAGARIAFLTFHSLEDRQVKRAFATLEAAGEFEVPAGQPVATSEAEVGANPRSRSAKLRWAKFLGRV